MIRARLRSAAVRLLLCLIGASPALGQPAGDRAMPRAFLAGVEILGGAQAAGSETRWGQALLAHWQERYGLWARLEAAADPAGAPARAQVRVEDAADGLRVGVSLQGPAGAPDGARNSAQVVVWGRSLEAGVQAAAGELAFLLASRSAFPPPEQPPPRLAAVIGLDSLALLRAVAAADGRGGAVGAVRAEALAEALAVAADPDGGVRLLLADRFLSLGPLLEISPRTAADLLFCPPFPAGFVPAALVANALGEPAVYDAGSGELLLYPAGGTPERFGTGIIQPMQAGELAGGSLAALQGRRLLLLHRRGSALHTTELALPTGLAAAVSAERPGALGVYDLAERRIRLLDGAGQEVGSVKPLLDPEAVPVPQLFRALPQGGFLLGGTGDLWALTPGGLPRWRLRELGTAPRESLPVFFSAAPARVPEGGAPALFLLDPLGRRLMRFVELQRPAQPASGRPEPSLEQSLAQGHERLAADPDSRAELIGLCLREGLLLQAHYLFSLGESGPQAARSLEGRILEEQAQRVAELARALEGELRLPEAQRAYNGALALLRELRGIDPVERRFPKAISDLTEARNAVRGVLVAEPLLAAEGLSVLQAGGAYQLRLQLRSLSARRLDELTVDVRMAVGAGAAPSLRPAWGSSPGALPARAAQALMLPVAVEAAAEDLRVQVHFLFAWRQGEAIGRQHLVLPVLLPLQAPPGP